MQMEAFHQFHEVRPHLLLFMCSFIINDKCIHFWIIQEAKDMRKSTSRDDMTQGGISSVVATSVLTNTPTSGSLEVISPTVVSLLAAPSPTTQLLLPSIKSDAPSCGIVDTSDQSIQSPVSVDTVARSVASETPSIKDDIPDDDSSVSHLDCSQVVWISSR